jgi:hypothetical protein
MNLDEPSQWDGNSKWLWGNTAGAILQAATLRRDTQSLVDRV